MSRPEPSETLSRRRFIHQGLVGGCALAWGAWTVRDFLTGSQDAGLRVGFRNDAPAELGPWSHPALWAEAAGGLVHCRLCPHECMLGENDRGFCRTRVVKEGKLHTLAYGNPAAVHIDPMEKKPLYHFLPGEPILSIATAGCNLRCINCQNWQLSQAKPDDAEHQDQPPARLVEICTAKRLRAIAYTYSDPIVFYEYTEDSAAAARERGIRNVLHTAGYINEAPLRRLCRVLDAANVDLKGFTDRFYREMSGARLAPILRTLEIMKEEGVWLEVTRLIVPAYSENLDDIRAMCDWYAAKLGVDTPLHFSRFHPAYKLQHLAPTPVDTMEKAYEVARAAGLRFVYVGNLPDTPHQHTFCPRCGERVMERRGVRLLNNRLQDGRCPCGERIPGVWL